MTLRFDSFTSMFVFCGLVVFGVGYCGIYRPIHKGNLEAERSRTQAAYAQLLQKARDLEAECRKPVEGALHRHMPNGLEYTPPRPGPISGPLQFLAPIGNPMIPVPSHLDGGRVCEVALPQEIARDDGDDPSARLERIRAAEANLKAPTAPARFGFVSTFCKSGVCTARLGAVSFAAGVEAIVEVTAVTKRSKPDTAELNELSGRVALAAGN